MAKTIHFNTGRKYTAHGQRITATLHDDGVVTFFDHDRMVDGQFEMTHFDTFGAALVQWKYDRYHAPNTKRSFEDGMQRGGCNSKYEENT
jgi:hypothetical protein